MKKKFNQNMGGMQNEAMGEMPKNQTYQNSTKSKTHF